jgi:ABC-type transport system involved in multi-copper enzyme maturation permease subunit
LQVLLLALLAPATTANAITQEKDRNTLDLLLLTDAGPFAIVWGKFFSRLFHLIFLLFLTVPLLFALLTLGGVAATSILVEFVILVSFAVLGAGLGIFLSTILPRTTGVLITGYALLAALLAAPLLLEQVGVTHRSRPGTYPLAAAAVSPYYDLIYLFRPAQFVASESFPSRWWVCPLWCVAAGLGLVWLSGLLLPRARGIEQVLSARKLLEAFDQLNYWWARRRGLRLKKEEERLAREARPIGKENPIYWKETSVNTIGRFKYWWRVNLVLLLLMVASYLAFRPLVFSDIEFHKVMVAVLAGLIVLLSTVIATTTVSREREDGSLVLLAATPIECATYIRGKVLGIARNISFLVLLPFLHVVLFITLGVIHPASLFLLLLAIPVAVVGSIMQGIFVSLLFHTTLRAILAGIVVVVLEGTLPAVCCLPTFNLPLTCSYVIEPLSGLGSSFSSTVSQDNYLTIMSLALAFSAGTQVGYVVVVYSLIRSGFDRYIGRAA